MDKNSPIPLYYQLNTIIMDELNKGNYKNGDMIPTEAELSRIFGISLSTVRQCITQLVREGYLYRVKSKGTFVSGTGGAPKSGSKSVTNCHLAWAEQSGEIELSYRETVPMPQEMVKLGASALDKAVFIRIISRCLGIAPMRANIYLPYSQFAFMAEAQLPDHISLPDIFSAKSSTRVVRILRRFEAVTAGDEDVTILGAAPSSPILKMTTTLYGAGDSLLGIAYSFCQGGAGLLSVETVFSEDD